MTKRRAAASARKRRYRLRRNGGKKVFRFAADPDDLAFALQGLDALAPGEHDHAAIEKAFQNEMGDWLQGWIERRHGP